VAEKFDPAHWDKLENPQRLIELPPAVLIRLLDLKGAETLVDFGAGTGLYDLPLAEALPNGTLFAVEELPELLDRLNAKLAAADPRLAARIRPVLTEGGRVPLPDATADRIVAINTIHHVHDDRTALAEMVRLLRPGGLMVVAEFGHMDRTIGPPKEHVLPHDELRALLTGLGLAEISVHEPGTLLQHHIAVVAQKPD
jgi:ubiquinone/menaquinone biosynthesis C-methylase UbiE